MGASNRTLKFYGDSRSMALSRRITVDVLGLASHIMQVSVMVTARTKADAMRYFQAAGLHITPREVRIQEGSDALAMAEAGLLVEGAIYTHSDLYNSKVVARVTGRDTAEAVGAWVRDPRARIGEDLRLELFDDPNAPRPRYLVIELDGDTPDDIVTALQQGRVSVEPINGTGFGPQITAGGYVVPGATVTVS